MITIDNYYNKVKDIKINELPETLKEGHEFVGQATKNGNSWAKYHSQPEIKETIDLYLKQIDGYLSKKKSAKPVPKIKSASARPQKSTKKPIKEKKVKTIKKTNRKVIEYTGKPVASVGEDVAMIRRCVNMHDKVKTKHQVLLYVNALERKIIERKIRKTSPYAAEIKFIQEWMVNLYNKMGDTIKIVIKEDRLQKLREISGSEKVRLSVMYIKRYVGLHGKIVTKEKVKRLHNAIANAVNKGRILKNDPYFDKLQKIIKSLREFNCAVPNQSLSIHQATLNGLKGVLDGCGCHELNGLEETNRVPPNTIMSSMDIVKLQFDKIGFMGKWLNLIGDPSPGFTAMIFGLPKMGKSYMAVEFAGYLARNHGTVLYVAKEEGIDDTLQKKLKEKDVAHPDLLGSNYLPDDLAPYDFIFLDSVTKLKLTPDDLEELKKRYPGKSFIYIFQTTKSGAFRGSNDFMHDVDVVIEVPEKGLAIQNGRFNQGGEMHIFEAA